MNGDNGLPVADSEVPIGVKPAPAVEKRDLFEEVFDDLIAPWLNDKKSRFIVIFGLKPDQSTVLEEHPAEEHPADDLNTHLADDLDTVIDTEYRRASPSDEKLINNHIKELKANCEAIKTKYAGHPTK